MKKLDEPGIKTYLQRSYGAVDGLWFMKVEEKLGFESALEIDRQVWEVLPKIQARLLKKLLDLENGLESLEESLVVRLELDGFEFTRNQAEGQLEINIHLCPWFQLMLKSGRQHLAGRVGEVVCATEYAAWCKEFGDGISVEITDMICKGASVCRFRFSNMR